MASTPPTNRFSHALRRARIATGRVQEDFGLLSSRTYVSTLERGIKSPTLQKVDELAQVLDLHPLTLLTLAYEGSDRGTSIGHVLARVRQELNLIHEQEHQQDA